MDNFPCTGNTGNFAEQGEGREGLPRERDRPESEYAPPVTCRAGGFAPTVTTLVQTAFLSQQEQKRSGCGPDLFRDLRVTKFLLQQSLVRTYLPGIFQVPKTFELISRARHPTGGTQVDMGAQVEDRGQSHFMKNHLCLRAESRREPLSQQPFKRGRAVEDLYQSQNISPTDGQRFRE